MTRPTIVDAAEAQLVLKREHLTERQQAPGRGGDLREDVQTLGRLLGPGIEVLDAAALSEVVAAELVRGYVVAGQLDPDDHALHRVAYVIAQGAWLDALGVGIRHGRELERDRDDG